MSAYLFIIMTYVSTYYIHENWFYNVADMNYYEEDVTL